MSIFKFKKFDIEQDGCAQKVGTDSMVLGAFVDHIKPKTILDIGTGNGILALMMAQKFENALITAVEIQEECAEVAQSNFRNSRFKNRLDTINADVNDFEASENFDLIVSNPPFFKNATPSSKIERTMARHQSSLNLEQLLRFAINNLSFNGAIWLVLPEERSLEIIDKATGSGLKLSRRIRVFGKPSVHKRDILVFVKTGNSINPVLETFTIRTSNGAYTDEYKSKTIEFHHSRL